MPYKKCGGYYNGYPDDCSACPRFMDDCDGSGMEEDVDERTLIELREHWENGLVPICNIPDDDNCFYVILKSEDLRVISPTYHLHRYFKLTGGWVVSVDVRSTDVGEVFKFLDKHNFMQEIPTE